MKNNGYFDRWTLDLTPGQRDVTGGHVRARPLVEPGRARYAPKALITRIFPMFSRILSLRRLDGAGNKRGL